MSNQNNQPTYNTHLLDFTEKEVSQLKEEIALLLKKPVTKEEIERIEYRLEYLEKMLYKNL